MATCETKLIKQFGDTFDKETISDIVNDLRDQRIRADGDEQINQHDIVTESLDKAKQDLLNKEFIEIRTAQKKIEELDKLKFFGKRRNRLREHIKSVLKGTQVAVKAARNSAELAVNTIKQLNLGYMINGLQKIDSSALVRWKKGKNNKMNLTAMWGRKSGDSIADSTGKLVNSIYENLRIQFAKEGIRLNVLPNRGFLTSHNKQKLLRTSSNVIERQKINIELRKAEEPAVKKFIIARTRWKRFILPLLDEKTFSNILGKNFTNEQVDKFLDKAFSSLTDQGKMTTTIGDIQARLERGRILIFNSPESQLSYAAEYGKGNLSDSVDAEIRHLSTQLGLLRKLGPDPKGFITDLFSKAIKLDKRITEARGEEPIQPVDLKATLDSTLRNLREIDGSIYDTAGVPGQIARAIKSAILIHLLPATTLTGFLLDSANLAEQLTRYGGTYPVNLGKSLLWMTKHSLIQDQDFKNFASLLGVFKDAHIGAFSRYTGTDTEEDIRILNRLEHISLALSGHARMDFAKRVANVATLAHSLSLNSAKAFEDIDPDLKNVLDRHGVDEHLWNVWKKHKMTIDNKDYMTTLSMLDVEDSEVRKYLADRNNNFSPSASQIDRGKTEIQNRLSELFQDTNDFAVLRPDSSKVFWTFGADPDTMTGRSLMALGQVMASFRSYQFALLTKTMQRFLYDKGAESIGDALVNFKWNYRGVAQYSASVMLLAATKVAAEHIIQGKKITNMDDFFEQTLRNTDIVPFLSILYPQKRTFENTVNDILGPAADSTVKSFMGVENLLSGNLSTKSAWYALYENWPMVNSLPFKRFWTYNLFNTFINEITGHNPGLGQPGGYNSHI